MSSDPSEKIFIKVLNFVHDLNDVFGKKYNNIKLYNKFLKETPMENAKAVKKQNSIFKNFVQNNFEAILKKDITLLEDHQILFSDKVFINIKEIVEEADQDTSHQIFQHLQLIAYLFTNDQNMKAALSNSYKVSPPISTKTDQAESEFIHNYMSKIEQSFGEKDFSDPMTATLGLLKSGVFTDMIKTLQTDVSSGKLDVNKLLGNVQGMMSQISSETKENGDAPPLDINSLMNGGMISQMLGGSSGAGLTDVMSMVGNILSETQPPQIEDITQEKDKDL